MAHRTRVCVSLFSVFLCRPARGSLFLAASRLRLHVTPRPLDSRHYCFRHFENSFDYQLRETSFGAKSHLPLSQYVSGFRRQAYHQPDALVSRLVCTYITQHQHKTSFYVVNRSSTMARLSRYHITMQLLSFCEYS